MSGFALLLCIALIFQVCARRRMRRQLSADRGRHRAVIDGIYDGYYEIDMRGNLVAWNKSLFEMTGYSDNDAFPKNYWRWIDLPTLRRLRRLFLQVYRSRQPAKGFTWVFQTKDGRTRFLEISVSLIEDERGIVSGYRGILRNVTRRRASEMALEENESRLRTLLNAMTDGVIFVDANNDWIELNHRAREIFRLPESMPVVTEADIVFAAREFSAALSASVVEERPSLKQSCHINASEVESMQADGRMATFHAIRVPVWDASAKSKGTLHIFRDVTEQKLADQRIRDSEQRYRSLIDNHNDVVLTLDFDGRIMDVNDAIKSALGHEPSDVVGQTFACLMPEENVSNALHVLSELYDGKAIEHFSKALHADGRILDVLVKKIPIIVNRHVTGAFSIVHDMTERNRLHRELESANKWNQLVLDSAGESILTIDKHGRVTRCNPAASQMLQLSEQEIVGCAFHKQFHHTRANGHPYLVDTCPIHQSMLDGRVRRVTDEVFWRKNGTSFPVEYVSSPIIENDKIVGAVIVAKDATQQKEAEELLLKSEKFSAVGQLAAGIAHEVRNPLTALKGFLQLLQEKTKEPQQAYFSIMFSELDRIASIVSEFLVLAKPQVSELRSCNPTDLVNLVVTLLEAEANLRNVRLNVQIVTAVPDVCWEVNRVKQVLLNLMKNAIEASGTGGKVDIQLQQKADTLEIRVIDEGAGIPEERLVRLGEPFYSTKAKGTGLGLMISRRIVEAHGGALEITTEVGHGTCVSVRLPLFLPGQQRLTTKS